MKTFQWFQRIAVGLLAPLALCAQPNPNFPIPESKAPAEVSQALRERVNQFFQYHIGSINRKAFDLVAEDTKDYYFSSGKVLFLGANITGVDFSQDMQKALVHLDTTQNMQVQQYSTVATTPIVTNWKIEDGKWFWFLDKQGAMISTTPMGASAVPPERGTLKAEPMLNPDGTLNIPKDFAEPERVAAQGQALIAQSGLDKDSVSITVGKAGTDTVTFHNGFSGPVSLKLYEIPSIPGLSVTLSKSDLGPREDAEVRFTFTPTDADIPDVAVRQYTLRLNLIPWNQEFPIRLRLQRAR